METGAADVHKNTFKAMTGKKTDDARERLKRLSREESSLREQLNSRKDKLARLRKEIEKNEAFLDKIKDSLRTLEASTEGKLLEKEANLCRLLRMQTRMRWYKLIREKRYKVRPINQDEVLASDPIALADQNQALAEGISALADNFPQLKMNLKSISCIVKADEV